MAADSTSQTPWQLAFVHSSWHADIVKGAQQGFLEVATPRVAAVETFAVPGAFELPLHARILADSGRFDAVVAAGLVVDGGIYRHEFVADAVISGLMQLQLDVGVPVFSCVLTPQQFHDHDTHHEFFSAHMIDKGREAAHACLSTLTARAALRDCGLTAPPASKAIVVDTTFARVDMGAIVAQRITNTAPEGDLAVERVTVPGFKDLTAASRRAIDDGAAIVVACGMPGPEPIDESCAREASLGLQTVQALTGVPVLEVFVHTAEALHEDATVNEDHLVEICRRRCEGHADNAVRMVLGTSAMTKRAGTGRRQGADDEGALPAAL